jgi:hypothetical protein
LLSDAVNLLDHLVRLSRSREESKRKLFLEFIEPMYRDVEKIAQDYIELFNELINHLQEEENVTELIKWIEERRVKLHPLRIKTRSLLVEFPELRHQSAERSKVPALLLFRRSIWGLMKGGLSLVEEGHADLHEYGWGNHTVLDFLYNLPRRYPSPRVTYAQAFTDSKPRLIVLARGQLECVKQAWKDTTIAYARLKKDYLAS